jgi:hypothetical protein
MKPELSIRLEVETLLVEWASRVDEGRAASAADLFCEDAEQDLMGAKSAGLAAIRATLQQRQDLVGRTSQHSISNVRITEIEGDLVRAQWVLTLFRSDDAGPPAIPFLVALGKDQYRRMADGQLKIWRRELLPRFRS